MVTLTPNPNRKIMKIYNPRITKQIKTSLPITSLDDIAKIVGVRPFELSLNHVLQHTVENSDALITYKLALKGALTTLIEMAKSTQKKINKPDLQLDIDSIAKMFHRINVNLNDASRIINEYQTTRDELLVEIKEASEENSLDLDILMKKIHSTSIPL